MGGAFVLAVHVAEVWPTEEIEPADFLASFPMIQSAIKVSGDGGMRIQLDIPESQLGNALGVVAWRNVVLRVKIWPVANETIGNGEHRTVSRHPAKRRIESGSPGVQ